MTISSQDTKFPFRHLLLKKSVKLSKRAVKLLSITTTYVAFLKVHFFCTFLKNHLEIAPLHITKDSSSL